MYILIKDNKMLIIQYKNKVNYSLNKLYTTHFSQKMKIKENIIENITINAEGRIENKYIVIVKINNRLDLDNNIGIIKIIIDHLSRSGYLVDDSPKFFKQINLIRDETLEKNTMTILIENII